MTTIYRINYTSREHADCIAWAGSQREAATKRSELVKQFGRANVDQAEPVEIRMKKAGLVQWLNENFTRAIDA